MANSNATLTINTFDIKKITFAKPSTNAYNSPTIQVLYDGNSRWVLQTPKMRVPFGPNPPMRKDGEPAPPPEKLVNYALDFSLSGYKDTERSAQVDTIKRFYDILVALNEKCVAEMVANSESWIDLDEVSPSLCQKKFYRNHIKEPTDKDPKKQEEKRKKYAPSFRAKLGVKEGNVLVDVLDATDNQKVKSIEEVTALLRGSESQAILQCAGLAFAAGAWGFNWRVHKIKAWPSSGSAYDFQDDDEEEGGEPIHSEFVDDASSAKPTNQVSDEDEDELDAPAPVKQPEPPKEPKSEVTIKKAVRKTKA